jgi:maleylacetate reductase
MTDGPAAFVYEAMPMRVRFGPGGAAELAAEIEYLGLRSVLAVSTPGQRDLAQRIVDPLGDRCVGVHAEARMHVPVEVAERARAEADRLDVDGVVAVGGGSAIGLAKAVALTSGRPIVAVPTTYAGSEMTTIWGLTEGAAKRTGRDPRVLPASVIYDPELTLGLPVDVSVTSGFNALAHAVEALYAPDRSPIISLMAREGIRSLTQALPEIGAAAADLGTALAARTEALYGAWLCGACLGATTMSLHHRLCHALGGTLDLPHAPTHTVVLPHVLAFNQAAVPEVPAGPLWELAGRLGAPRSLAALGMRESDIDLVADQVMAAPYANPRPVTRDALVALLHDAWSGAAPATDT